MARESGLRVQFCTLDNTDSEYGVIFMRNRISLCAAILASSLFGRTASSHEIGMEFQEVVHTSDAVFVGRVSSMKSVAHDTGFISPHVTRWVKPLQLRWVVVQLTVSH